MNIIHIKCIKREKYEYLFKNILDIMHKRVYNGAHSQNWEISL